MHLLFFQWNKLLVILSLAFTVVIAILLAKTCYFELIVKCDTSLVGILCPRLSCELTTGSRKNIDNLQQQTETFKLLINGSSTHCFGRDKRGRICRFRNFCYSPKFDKYIFFHGVETSQRGVPKNRYDPALLDLTSVDDHNTQYFNYVDFPASSVGVDFKDIELVESPSLLFHRFNPNNLMHVIHDDLIPLWMTLKLLFTPSGYSPVQLVMMDGNEKGPWFELYQLVSKSILLKDDVQKWELTCFKDIVVGLSKETTWYQYGFKVPQGPITEHTVSRSHLSLFAHEFMSNYKCREDDKQSVVLISRKQTRRILNQLEVSITLANFFKKEVAFLDFELQSVDDAICMIKNAVGLVGMHGAELILALFLPPGSAIVELFPYGINPDNYTPYKTLARIKGLEYVAWRNINPENTQSYPDRPPKQGGISHLPKSLQDKISSSTEVPKHLCCDDPFWLHRIYQDTFIDTTSLEACLSKLKSSQEEKSTSLEPLLYPDVVQQPSCLISRYEDGAVELRISWLPPINAKYVGSDDLKYQVLVQRDEDINVSAYELSNTELLLKNIEFKRHCKLWIRCKLEDIVGALSRTVNCTEL